VVLVEEEMRVQLIFPRVVLELLIAAAVVAVEVLVQETVAQAAVV
jgi:hypothetical protein